MICAIIQAWSNVVMPRNSRLPKGVGRPDPIIAEAMAALVTKPKRKHISAKKRAAIMARDGHSCFYCGGTENLEVDHIVAFAGGGTDDDGNLVTACKRCNIAKKAQSASGFQMKRLDKRLRP